MTDGQWLDLLRVLDGELLSPLPVGVIVDSPWLPGWAGVSIMDYFSNESVWLETNLKVVRRFPDVMFLPGFWSEFGMCTEPSAFGSRCVFPENEFPFPEKTLRDISEIDRVVKPNCRADGLLPFMIKRLVHCQDAIEEAGHRIRFATSRGPLNIATYLLGHTEFLMAVKTDPEPIHRLLRIVTEFIVDWLAYQKECFPSIEGIFVLDDLVGFLGEADFKEFALPYVKQVFAAFDAPVRAFHNDAPGLVSAPYLEEAGINLFNFSFKHGLAEMRARAGENVTLLGNIPPRDVFAQGTSSDVRRSVAEQLATLADRRRVIVSCGGGAPPNVPTANVEALLEAAVC